MAGNRALGNEGYTADGLVTRLAQSVAAAVFANFGTKLDITPTRGASTQQTGPRSYLAFN